MIYLTVAEVLFIHSAVVDETGGSHGLRDLKLLESAVAQPRQTFGGHDLYKGITRKAAILLVGLLKNHPFVDGNKRTALTVCGVFLQLNGWDFNLEDDELARWVEHLAGSQTAPRTVAKQLRKNVKRLRKPSTS